MMIKPTIGDQMSSQGIRKEDVEFDIAITKYLNAGGTIERAQDRLLIAAEKMPAPVMQRTPDGHSGLADAGHSGEATNSPASKARLLSASPQPYHQSRTRRDLTAIASAQAREQAGVRFTETLPDEFHVGSCTYLPGYLKRFGFHGAAKLICGCGRCMAGDPCVPFIILVSRDFKGKTA